MANPESGLNPGPQDADKEVPTTISTQKRRFDLDPDLMEGAKALVGVGKEETAKSLIKKAGEEKYNHVGPGYRDKSESAKLPDHFMDQEDQDRINGHLLHTFRFSEPARDVKDEDIFNSFQMALIETGYDYSSIDNRQFWRIVSIIHEATDKFRGGNKEEQLAFYKKEAKKAIIQVME